MAKKSSELVDSETDFLLTEVSVLIRDMNSVLSIKEEQQGEKVKVRKARRRRQATPTAQEENPGVRNTG